MLSEKKLHKMHAYSILPLIWDYRKCKIIYRERYLGTGRKWEECGEGGKQEL